MTESLNEAMLEMTRAAKRMQRAQTELFELKPRVENALKAHGLSTVRDFSESVNAPTAHVSYCARSDCWQPGGHQKPENSFLAMAGELNSYAELLEQRIASLRSLQKVAEGPVQRGTAGSAATEPGEDG